MDVLASRPDGWRETPWMKIFMKDMIRPRWRLPQVRGDRRVAYALLRPNYRAGLSEAELPILLS